MKVLVALSGGVDSSVAAALLLEQGHEVVGVTMRLWGGDSDSGCCSVADVDDARRVAQQLGIDHHVFNFSDEFTAHVVQPYVDAHRDGLTPNPCIECNRHLKFDRLAERARVVGFDAVATGHHARLVRGPGGATELRRGRDRAKDQSYVVHMLPDLDTTLFPVGDMTKAEVRDAAARLGLRTADKPDSQDVCFIAGGRGGREAFLGARIPLRAARVVDEAGVELGEVASIETVTLGQRRNLGIAGGGARRFVIGIDAAASTVTVGPESRLLRDVVAGEAATWLTVPPPVGAEVLVQASAHGVTHRATVERADEVVALRWDEPQRVVAPGQSVVLYDLDDDRVLGGATALRAP